MADEILAGVDHLPQAVWSGSFKLFGVDLKVHTLSDGRRIIEADSMAQLFEAMAEGSEMGDAEGFARWKAGT